MIAYFNESAKNLRDASSLGQYLGSLGMVDTISSQSLAKSLSDMQAGKKIGCPAKFTVFHGSDASHGKIEMIDILLVGVVESSVGCRELLLQYYTFRNDTKAVVLNKISSVIECEVFVTSAMRFLKEKYTHILKRMKTCDSYRDALALFYDVREGRI